MMVPVHNGCWIFKSAESEFGGQYPVVHEDPIWYEYLFAGMNYS